MLTGTLSGRKKCGRKRCTTNRENCSLERLVKQNRFKNLGELHKEWTEAVVKASRATTHRRVREFQNQNQKGFYSPVRKSIISKGFLKEFVLAVAANIQHWKHNKTNKTTIRCKRWLQLSYSFLEPKEKKNWTIAQWSKVLFSDMSKFCISFSFVLESGRRVEKLITQVA